MFIIKPWSNIRTSLKPKPKLILTKLLSTPSLVTSCQCDSILNFSGSERNLKEWLSVWETRSTFARRRDRRRLSRLRVEYFQWKKFAVFVTFYLFLYVWTMNTWEMSGTTRECISIFYIKNVLFRQDLNSLISMDKYMENCLSVKSVQMSSACGPS